MSAPKFRLEVVTPEGVVFSKDVVSFKAPGSEGQFGVLANHAPFMTSLEIGPIELFDGSESYYLATTGGFTEVLPHKTIILAETAETKGEIDIERARTSLERAQKRLEAKSPDLDVERAQLSLHRALNRLRVVGVK
ncbi:MAG: F0F1 ATP synthase subunit epsilon [candidate division Zixibacteria bacterium]|nr:F0F1 ATP synthase subunit epsilon [Candidatus Tariuqbacter arcticus]